MTIKPMYLGDKWGFKFYLFRVEYDFFFHLTSEKKLELILSEGVLKPKGLKKEVSAISGVYGNAESLLGSDKSVVIRFKTDTIPKDGYPNEVLWDKDVVLKSVEVISIGDAKVELDSSVDLGEEFNVIYNFEEALILKGE